MKLLKIKMSLPAVCAVLLTAVASFSNAAGPGVSTGHDRLKPVSTGATSTHNRFTPKLVIEHGCQPFAAVDDSGNYNAGLNNSGAHNGGCSSSPSGQAYARSACVGEYCGHMFVYYMPKDNGVPFAFFGHRHDFEEIVVWTRNNDIIGAAYSAHGDYYYDENPYLSNGRVNASYGIDAFTHSMGAVARRDRGDGTVWPAASWELLTPRAKQALNDPSNWSAGNFAARDDNFKDKLNEARTRTVVNAGIRF
ncbi:NPP1 family protein [Marinibactrum halimedae]|uniref:Necrosis inducing protein (NPP1) n=1 Tax=Marinibactrum halimedae TaxID=1444977 RepID=A0AA37WNU7_9GAMM|nr:NPP1 family protein [Marinibactrum halimedae]MCD9458740.1 NPP1 family protein [Marinibactrum halimedae]GLS25297.1 hypothetical protein GCM10007877_10110 [Marinibactrum halimedae]